MLRNISEFRLKEINKTRNYLIEEIKQNKLINKKEKKVCRILKYTEHLLILASTLSGCVSIFSVASLIGIPVGISSSAIIKKFSAILYEFKIISQ